MSFLVATNVVASRPLKRRAVRLERRTLVPIQSKRHIAHTLPRLCLISVSVEATLQTFL